MSERGARMCCGKRRYTSERKADVAAARMQRKAQTAMHSYSCSLCKGWHTGSVERREPVERPLPRRIRYLQKECQA